MNTLMAAGTGLIMGLVAMQAIGGGISLTTAARTDIVFVITLSFLFISQIVIASYFWRNRRGEFEYSFLEKTAMRKKLNPELSRQLKEVKRELKTGGVNSAHERLIAVSKAFPDNFVAHFMFALSCERMRLADAAIQAYETANKLLPASAQALATYVEKQIRRVKVQGPSKMSTAPGLQYLTW